MFQDIREVDAVECGSGPNARVYECKPDVQADFRSMPYQNESFKMVVFDPPHFTSTGPKSYMGLKYGTLDKDTWPEDLKAGFSECFRILETGGVLIFKWNEHNIKLKEILSLTDYKPLFGHVSGKQQKTHWVCFMKLSDFLK